MSGEKYVNEHRKYRTILPASTFGSLRLKRTKVEIFYTSVQVQSLFKEVNFLKSEFKKLAERCRKFVAFV